MSSFAVLHRTQAAERGDPGARRVKKRQRAAEHRESSQQPHVSTGYDVPTASMAAGADMVETRSSAGAGAEAAASFVLLQVDDDMVVAVDTATGVELLTFILSSGQDWRCPGFQAMAQEAVEDVLGSRATAAGAAGTAGTAGTAGASGTAGSAASGSLEAPPEAPASPAAGFIRLRGGGGPLAPTVPAQLQGQRRGHGRAQPGFTAAAAAAVPGAGAADWQRHDNHAESLGDCQLEAGSALQAAAAAGAGACPIGGSSRQLKLSAASSRWEEDGSDWEETGEQEQHQQQQQQQGYLDSQGGADAAAAALAAAAWHSPPSPVADPATDALIASLLAGGGCDWQDMAAAGVNEEGEEESAAEQADIWEWLQRQRDQEQRDASLAAALEMEQELREQGQRQLVERREQEQLDHSLAAALAEQQQEGSLRDGSSELSYGSEQADPATDALIAQLLAGGGDFYLDDDYSSSRLYAEEEQQQQQQEEELWQEWDEAEAAAAGEPPPPVPAVPVPIPLFLAELSGPAATAEEQEQLDADYALALQQQEAEEQQAAEAGTSAAAISSSSSSRSRGGLWGGRPPLARSFAAAVAANRPTAVRARQTLGQPIPASSMGSSALQSAFPSLAEAVGASPARPTAASVQQQHWQQQHMRARAAVLERGTGIKCLNRANGSGNAAAAMAKQQRRQWQGPPAADAGAGLAALPQQLDGLRLHEDDLESTLTREDERAQLKVAILARAEAQQQAAAAAAAAAGTGSERPGSALSADAMRAMMGAAAATAAAAAAAASSTNSNSNSNGPPSAAALSSAAGDEGQGTQQQQQQQQQQAVQQPQQAEEIEKVTVKSLRKVLLEMKQKGWRQLQGGRGGHHKFERVFPELGGWRQVYMVCSSPSDVKYLKNMRAGLARMDRQAAEKRAELGVTTVLS